jgi:quercetin dioxygenase-like cupin family protein
MHSTHSIDFVVVLDGEMTLMLGDGQELTLHPGDTVVQRGVAHAWLNRGMRDARAAVCLVGE